MFDLANLTLLAAFALVGLALAAGMTWAGYQNRLERLPAATRYADIAERLVMAQEALHRAEEAKRALDRQIHDRDRLAAEVAQLQARLDETRLELDNLAAARAEIDRVKQEAAEAATAKAKISEEVTALRAEADRLRAELDPERIEELARRKADAAAELGRVQAELERLRPELDGALRQLAEGRAAEARVAALTLQQAELEALAQQRDRLAEEVAAARTALEVARAELHAAEADRDAAEHRRRDAETRTAELEQRLAQLRQEAQAAGAGAGGATAPDPAGALADLVAPPACLAAPGTLRKAPRSEAEALGEVARHLRACGLRFSTRTVRAFHAALKVNDTAQLTVLAGVSGTGKSLLPRRYAEAMGIHFLQIAVEPRWDSPQDLLGFYNYVERRYRATELARLMAHLDPWQSLELPAGTPDRRDHLAMVLLDEMNLARVEYYFSEFLSRLEARPPWRETLSRDDCRDALIEVDIRGRGRDRAPPPRLFPAHNILFVGTMNDDESTQSLSDKVLDRGNILQFPAPTAFPPPSGPAAAAAPAADAQSFAGWRRWVRDAGALAENEDKLTHETVCRLAEIMQGFGRPFGHRLNAAIRAYVANYPFAETDGRDLRVPLADQIELRILPRLRGIEIDSHRNRLEELMQLIRRELDDASLADRLETTTEDQARGANLFFWRGLARED